MTAEAEVTPGTDKSPEVDGVEVRAIIRALRSRKTPGLDRIENEVLKATAKTISPNLATLYKACLQHKTFLSFWKKARIITLLKGGGRNRGDVSSYLLIFLLPALSKVMEKILRTILLNEVQNKKSNTDSRRGGIQRTQWKDCSR